MAWCDSCSAYSDTNASHDEHECSKCGAVITVADAADSPTVGQSAPWHFWLLVVALAGYLAWRVVDLVISLVS